MKIELTKQEIMEIPNNMMLGEYVRRKLFEALNGNYLTELENKPIFELEDKSSLNNGSGSSEGRASV